MTRKPESFSETIFTSVAPAPGFWFTPPLGSLDPSEVTGWADSPSLSQAESELTGPARAALAHLENRELAERAMELVELVEAYIGALAGAGRDLGSMPPLRASQSGEGSVSLEWASPDFNIGFNVEPNSEESGWHIAFSQRLGEEAAAGFLTPANMRTKVAQLLQTAIARS